MKKIHTFDQFNEHLQLDGYTSSPNLPRATEMELLSFKKALKNYSDERKENKEVHDRALELLDEVYSKQEMREELYFWLLNGKTLKLQELLRKTTYKGNGNSPEQLRDFNAFALLDTVRGYYSENRNK